MGAWRAKLGLILPSWNTVMELESQRMAPPGVSIHSARIPHTADTEANLLWMGDQVPAAAQLLAHARVDAVCYGCTAGGFLKGPAYDAALAAEVTKTTGIPATVTSAAVVDALRHLGVRRVSVASPYEAWLNAKLQDYLKASGFDVVAIAGFGTQEHGRCTPEETFRLALGVDRPDAEGIFISCTNFRTLEIIEGLERERGKPVVSSNTASMWKLLRLAGIAEPLAGTGRLLAAA